MEPRPFTIARLRGPDDVADAARLYALAFLDNGAYDTIFLLPRGSDEQRAAYEWFFTRRLRAFVAAGNAFYVARDDATGAVVGAVGLLAPDRRPSLLALLWHGLAAWVCAYGPRSLLRALDVDDRLKAGRGDVALAAGLPPGTVPHELSMMAVHPAWQRHGVGRALLARALADHDDAARAAGRLVPPPIVLDTQLAGAVPFYERAGGFVVARTMDVRFTGDGTVDPRCGFTSWFMVRRQP
jgi:GNAT superfamily N-acetyltransferase